MSLIGPFRDQALDRPGRLKELEGVFKSGAHSFEERIKAIDEATSLTTGADADQSTEALMELVMKPEAGLTFSFRESLSQEWRDHNHVKLSMLWMHGLTAILRLLRRGEIEDKKSILKQVIHISLNHPRDLDLIHLEKDWPADDPHRVAPYLIDPDRAQRLILGELLDQLTDGLDYDPRRNDDHQLYNRTSEARQYMRANELKIRKYLKTYDPISSPRRNRRGERFAAVLEQYRSLYQRLPLRPDILFRTQPFAYKRLVAPKELGPGT